MGAGHAMGNDGRDDFADFRRLGAAIGIAQHDPAGAGIIGGFGAGQRIGRIGLVTVEEMLTVDHRFLAGGNDSLDRGLDRFEIFRVGAAKCDADVIVPALGDQTDRVALRLQKAGQPRIVGGGHAGALGHAEGDETGFLRALFAEEFGIGRIGTRIAAFDIIHAEIIQHRRNRDLVLNGKINARRLLAVAQRGVEEVDAFSHCSISLKGAL